MTNKPQQADGVFIPTKSTRRDRTQKGNEKFQLNFSQEAAIQLLEEITKNIENPRGIKLSMITSRKVAKESGREFDSTSVLVSGIQEFGSGTSKGKKIYQPKTKTTQDDIRAKIQALKGE